jgi:hypothetical protein
LILTIALFAAFTVFAAVFPTALLLMFIWRVVKVLVLKVRDLLAALLIILLFFPLVRAWASTRRLFRGN